MIDKIKFFLSLFNEYFQFYILIIIINNYVRKGFFYSSMDFCDFYGLIFQRECNVIRCIVENDTKHNFYDSTRPLKKGLFTICNISELLKTKKFPKQYKELVSKEVCDHKYYLFILILLKIC